MNEMTVPKMTVNRRTSRRSADHDKPSQRHLSRAHYDNDGGGLFSSKRTFVIDRFWRKEDVRLESKGYLFGASGRYDGES
jgi:hypothetical protein